MKLWQILMTCLLVGIATGTFAQKKGKSIWFWGVVGTVFFGIIVHTIVGICVFLIFA